MNKKLEKQGSVTSNERKAKTRNRRITCVFDIDIDVETQASALDTITRFAGRDSGDPDIDPALVVTPNLDHAIRHRWDDGFRQAYKAADLVLADGFPLIWASHLGGTPLPERVAGSDLVRPVCRSMAAAGLPIFILGTTLEILSIACRELHACNPKLEIAGVYSPSYGFDADHPESDEAVDMINQSGAALLFVALGSPKQELWAMKNRHRLKSAAIVCVGASFDFIAERPKRAPRLVQALCMEWFWRLAREPGRLGRRYAMNLVFAPMMMWQHYRHHRVASLAEPAADHAAGAGNRLTTKGHVAPQRFRAAAKLRSG